MPGSRLLDRLPPTARRRLARLVPPRSRGTVDELVPWERPWQRGLARAAGSVRRYGGTGRAGRFVAEDVREGIAATVLDLLSTAGVPALLHQAAPGRRRTIVV